jgi:hypothetical protein
MEADISILLKTGHFYFALTRPHEAFEPLPNASAEIPNLDGHPD